jgi:hypothetical protein
LGRGVDQNITFTLSDLASYYSDCAPVSQAFMFLFKSPRVLHESELLKSIVPQ